MSHKKIWNRKLNFSLQKMTWHFCFCIIWEIKSQRCQSKTENSHQSTLSKPVTDTKWLLRRSWCLWKYINQAQKRHPDHRSRYDRVQLLLMITVFWKTVTLRWRPFPGSFWFFLLCFVSFFSAPAQNTPSLSFSCSHTHTHTHTFLPGFLSEPLSRLYPQVHQLTVRQCPVTPDSWWIYLISSVL